MATCLLCNQKFDSLTLAKEHQDKEHPNQVHVRCGYCGLELTSHSKMSEHKNTVHPGWQEDKAPITKEFTTTCHSHYNLQRGNPSTAELPVVFDVVITPNPPQGIKGYGYFKGRWYNARQTGSQTCNLCGFPLVKYPTETDDPEMAEVYIPWRNFKLNEVHYKDVEPGKKFARTFNDALNNKWEIKHD